MTTFVSVVIRCGLCDPSLLDQIWSQSTQRIHKEHDAFEYLGYISG